MTMLQFRGPSEILKSIHSYEPFNWSIQMPVLPCCKFHFQKRPSWDLRATNPCFLDDTKAASFLHEGDSVLIFSHSRCKVTGMLSNAIAVVSMFPLTLPFVQNGTSCSLPRIQLCAQINRCFTICSKCKASTFSGRTIKSIYQNIPFNNSTDGYNMTITRPISFTESRNISSPVSNIYCIKCSFV